MSHFVDLHIVVPEAFILGSGEHHVDVGSGISLICMIEKVRPTCYYNNRHQIACFKVTAKSTLQHEQRSPGE
jgi:hypothetical protein